MSRLLYANTLRTKKSKGFWIGMIVMASFAFMIIISNYGDMVRWDVEITVDSLLFTSMVIIGMVIAAFVSMFIGTEYSDGTIRNKIMIGHRRRDVYLSSFITSFVTGILMNLVAFLIICIVGIPLFGTFKVPISLIALCFFDSILVIGVFAALFNLITLLSGNKATAVVICLLLSFALLMAGSYLLNMLTQPEMYDAAKMVDGEIVIETVRNPRYLTGMKREVYQFIADCLPTSQAFMLSAFEVVHPKLMALYSVVEIVGINMIGIIFFGKKNIK